MQLFMVTLRTVNLVNEGEFVLNLGLEADNKKLRTVGSQPTCRIVLNAARGTLVNLKIWNGRINVPTAVEDKIYGKGEYV